MTRNAWSNFQIRVCMSQITLLYRSISLYWNNWIKKKNESPGCFACHWQSTIAEGGYNVPVRYMQIRLYSLFNNLDAFACLIHRSKMKTLAVKHLKGICPPGRPPTEGEMLRVQIGIFTTTGMFLVTNRTSSKYVGNFSFYVNLSSSAPHLRGLGNPLGKFTN